MCVDDEQLTYLEQHVEKNRCIMEKFKCDHTKSYCTSDQFKFLPGHRAFLLNWCQKTLKARPHDEETDTLADTFMVKDEAFSPILREIISSALFNHSKTPNNHRYSKLLMEFSVFMYIMAGKASYELSPEQ